MKVLLIALTFLFASSSSATDRKKLVSETQEVDDNNGQLMDPNHSHYIPPKHYKPGSGEISIINDNDHHYIPRKDWDKSGQITITHINDHQFIITSLGRATANLARTKSQAPMIMITISREFGRHDPESWQQRSEYLVVFKSIKLYIHVYIMLVI